MSGFDANTVHAVPVLRPDPSSSSGLSGGLSSSEFNSLLRDFIMAFRVGGDFIYRDQLRANVILKQYLLDVDLRHVGLFHEELGHAIQVHPGVLVPLFEKEATRCAKRILEPGRHLSDSRRDGQRSDDEEDTAQIIGGVASEIPLIQVMIHTGMNMQSLRNLTSESMNKLIRTPGIVIQTATLQARATKLALRCRVCGSTKRIYPTSGIGGIGTGGGRGEQGLPRICDAPPLESGQKKDCGLDPYQIMHDKCEFMDSQTLKLQEAPDMVPVGELPRHLILFADRYLTSRVAPGSRVIVTGIYSTFNVGKNKNSSGAVAVRQPYLRLLHIEQDTSFSGSHGAFGSRFTPQEEEEFAQMARSPAFYERFANSVAPSIFGSLDIKKAIACLLFGGSKKLLPDGMRLRGDINVLLLGDPGTAKSQLLKFVEKVAPIAVYTSGKGSSAAGLTASVQRDSTSREFYLEGGAMVLADGGVVCIDEFDKMRDEDRVAIHEAMEQQTISIAKAGITTVLNSRASVLAAANPVFGRYDEARSAGDNIDFQVTILSRFDMIFIVKDTHDEARDKAIAEHVVGLHMNRVMEVETNVEGELSLEKMKRYIAFCKAKCAPRLTPEAATLLSSHFVAFRKEVQQLEAENRERNSIPMTARQLEAIIRISEALAKMTLSPTVHEHHVNEAIRLFKTSTMDAVTASGVEGISRGELNEEVQAIEKEIRKRLPIGWSTSYQALVKEFVQNQGFTQHALDRSLYILEKREVIRFSNQKKVVHRSGV
ncbi:MCM2/3/5 family-domain-containing protein [Cantharellus anzutake]|uniref:MCM2/3/5 family-domain-containing protein n=1 Tax=Cantharellus anzutake TaxID=1750568 RepID=UPI001907E10E|nr:MCM2/3/5 family-domain-containing protein [Cantharellus anzutake]KAF8329815.1 MCM2/3/5 family-domain-containing protein [Cantharellus anzutake]